jgi:hypothetical protein
MVHMGADTSEGVCCTPPLQFSQPRSASRPVDSDRRIAALLQLYLILTIKHMNQILAAIQKNVQAGDSVKFQSGNFHRLGIVVSVDTATVSVRLFKDMDSATLNRYCLRPIVAEEYPLAAQDQVAEVYLTSDELLIERCDIVDVAFILPIQEVESGIFFLSGSENSFCLRYILAGNEMKSCHPSFYFSRFLVEPLSVRLFVAINTLAHHLRKSLYHQPESAISKKSFRLPMFSMEAFWYLAYRLMGKSIGTSIVRKQSTTKYYNTLSMELCCKENTMNYLRILSMPALNALRQVLGLGIGLGLAKRRPTKSAPIVYCSIGGILTSVECGPEIPYELLISPNHPCAMDGIDFIFYEQTRTLSCSIRFTKIVVSDEAVATSRIPMARVTTSAESGVYVNVWFHHNAELFEVTAIDNNTVTCINVEQPESQPVTLPLNLVATLVAQFGNS